MAQQPYIIEQFGGLNLAVSQENIGAEAALDLLNVDLNIPGQFRTRDGYAKFTSSALAGDVLSLASLYPNAGHSSPILFAWGGGTYYALDNTGAAAMTYTPGSSTVAPMWSPGPFTFATYNGASGRVIKSDSGGLAWTTLNITASVDTADVWSVIGSTPYSDRLVLAGGTTLPDRVVFSDSGVGAWTANNFVDLPNDDGALTTGAVTYRDTLILFKENKFYVFGTEGLDGSGNPEFFYRVVATGIGLAGRFGAAAAPEGVYFVDRDGIYLTRGDAPTKISGAIDSMFRGDSLAVALGLDVSQAYLSQAAATYYRERLYVAITTGGGTTNNRLLVFDPKTNAWVVWDIQAASLCAHRTTTTGDEALFFGYAAGSNDIGQHFRSYTDDAGASIPWRYVSGKYAVSQDSGRVAVIVDTSVTGMSLFGSVSFILDSDTMALTYEAHATIDLPVTGLPSEGFMGLDQEGKFFQYQISGLGPGQISRITHYISFVKPAGVQ